MGAAAKLCLVSLLFFGQPCRSSNFASDGYIFENKEYENTSITVHIKTYKNRNQFDRAANKHIRGNVKVDMFSVIRIEDTHHSCTIHMIEPIVEYAPEFMGHELAHCVWGRFHQRQNAIQAARGERPKNVNAAVRENNGRQKITGRQ